MEMITLKTVETPEEMSSFLKIFTHWTKEGSLGFIPLFILHRAKASGHLWILVESTNIKAIIYLIPRQRPTKFYQLKTLAVDPHCQSLGYGRAMLTQLRDRFSDLPWHLEVSTSNAKAISLYCSLGFTLTGKRQLASGLDLEQWVWLF